MPDSFLRPVSPPSYTRAANSPYFQIALYAGGNVLAVGICLLLWFCWDVLSAFEEPLLWAWLCSLSLRDIKRYLVTTARRELQTSSFLVCVAKLVFLPVVILWQLFEEVRDQLQSKYHELQQKTSTQVPAAGEDQNGPAASATDGSAKPLQQRHRLSKQNDDDEPAAAGADPSYTAVDGAASNAAGLQPAAAAGTADAGSSNGSVLLKQPHKQQQQQQLRQRKAAADKQQQQRRPPLDPSRTASVQLDSRKRATAAPVAAMSKSSKTANASVPPAGRKSTAAAVAATAAAAAAAKRSKFQWRLRRWKHIALKQLRWWWFCIKELVKFLLRGLLPQQQQQQQQQVVQPGGSMTPGGVGLKQGLGPSSTGFSSLNGTYNDTSAISTPMRVSLTGSYSSSIASDWGHPWTPPQQHWQQQQQLLQLQQQHRRLSSSYSSPALNLEPACSYQLQPGTAAAAAVHGSGLRMAARSPLVSRTPSTVSAAATAGAGAGAGYRLNGITADDSMLGMTSYDGWSPEQQQQQQPALSRCESSSSSSNTSQLLKPAAVLPAAAAARGSSSPPPPAAAAANVMPGGSSSEFGSRTPSISHIGCNGTSTPPPAMGYSSPASAAGFSSPVAAGLNPVSSLGLHNTPSTGFYTPMIQTQGLGHMESANSVFSIAGWECGQAAAAAATAPSSVVMAMGGGGGSHSSLLFKWLLRGIVLYEGYSYAQGFLSDAEPLFVLLLLVGGVLALAGGLPFLLLPGSLWRSPTLHDKDSELFSSDGRQQQQQQRRRQQHKGFERILSPFQQQQQDDDAAAAAAAAAAAKRSSSGSSSKTSYCKWISSTASTAWNHVVQILVKADVHIRSFCASTFLDTAVSGLIVIGLILGSVILSVILVVQVGEESRQAVVHLNTLVRNKGTEAALRQGVKSLLQDEYIMLLEGQVTSMLKDSLPSLTQYVESRASEFLISHNLSKVLLDLENVKSVLKLPGDCSEEAKMQLAVQLANSSLAVQQLGQQRQQLQQQGDRDRKLLSDLAVRFESVHMLGLGFGMGVAGSPMGDMPESKCSKSRPAATPAAAAAGDAVSCSEAGDGDHDAGSGSSSSSEVAQQLLDVQERLAGVEDVLHDVNAAYELAQEQLQLAQLRLRNCQPTTSVAAADTDAASHSRSILSSFWSFGSQAPAVTAAAAAANGGSSSHNIGHVSSRIVSALVHWDFASASKEVAAFLGQLYPEDEQQQQQQQIEQQGDDGLVCDLIDVATCPIANSSSSSSRQPQCMSPTAAGHSSSTNNTSAAAAAPSSSSSGATTSIMRVAQGAAYPLITSLRHLGSVFLAGVGSTTAVALGTGLGVLRLGLGVVKFLVQLGVFASVLYTLLALDIDPVEQLLRLLPMSEASQDRASRAVTKAMRGVFVSSLKLAAFHAGFTWLTLRAFGTHFVTLASAASAVVAVLPLVPVALVALPGVLELVLLRGAPVKGVVLAALHFGAYYFGDDLIYREVEPTLPYLVGLGVFGGMYSFRNPLRGVVLGPMMLALLSVGYNLHRDMY